MDETFTDNAETKRYELPVDGKVVFATYRKDGDTMHILHVEAPPVLRGTGAANRFMRELMHYLRAHDLKMFPVCSYAVAWLARNREFQDLLG